jgi:hypothetical protein
MKHFNPHGYEIYVFELQRPLDVNTIHMHMSYMPLIFNNLCSHLSKKVRDNASSNDGNENPSMIHLAKI